MMQPDLLFHHLICRKACAVNDLTDVEIKNLVDEVIGEISQQGAPHQCSSVVDEHVNAAEQFQRLGNQLVRRARLGEVEADRLDPRCFDGLQFLATAEILGQNACTGLGKAKRRSTTNARDAARHHDGLALQIIKHGKLHQKREKVARPTGVEPVFTT
jgi:hypothetical protein